MKDYIDIRKNGCFYNVYGDDCYILFYLFKYKINSNKVGFHNRSINSVINKLNYYKVNYNFNNNKVCFGKINSYYKYVELGKNKYIEYNKLIDIENKVLKLDNHKLKDTYNILKDYV